MPQKPFSAAAMAALAGLALGGALDVITAWMARAGPMGDGWSFRGNGALVVPLGLGAAALAGGWASVSVYARGIGAWLGVGLVIGAVGAIPALLSVIVLVIFGSAAQAASDLLTIPAFAWPLLTLVFAVALQIPRAEARRLSAPFTLLAGAVFAIAMIAGLFGAGAMFPPGAA